MSPGVVGGGGVENHIHCPYFVQYTKVCFAIHWVASVVYNWTEEDGDDAVSSNCTVHKLCVNSILPPSTCPKMLGVNRDIESACGWSNIPRGRVNFPAATCQGKLSEIYLRHLFLSHCIHSSISRRTNRYTVTMRVWNRGYQTKRDSSKSGTGRGS